MSNPIQNRYDFVYLFDVTDGNPNGDPDAGNLPRIDAETGQGLVTDVCLKRKVRNYVGTVHEEKPPYEIYIKEKAVLNLQHNRAYTALSIDPKKREAKGVAKAEEDKNLTKWMCQNFYDIRTFGAVMTTEVNAGQVRGPVQLTVARSIDPIVSQEHAVTRCAVTTERESEKQGGDNRTMGRKFTVPYGLYMGFGYINATLAAQTGFGDDDLTLFKQALNMMFEGDRSAARGGCRRSGASPSGTTASWARPRADQLFARVSVKLKDEVKAEKWPARSKEDYVITVDAGDLPEGVTVEQWV